MSVCQSAPVAMQVGEGQQVQIVQAAQGQATAAQAQGQTMQVMQQIITNTGEIQQIPVRIGTKIKDILMAMTDTHKCIIV